MPGGASKVSRIFFTTIIKGSVPLKQTTALNDQGEAGGMSAGSLRHLGQEYCLTLYIIEKLGNKKIKGTRGVVTNSMAGIAEACGLLIEMPDKDGSPQVCVLLIQTMRDALATANNLEEGAVYVSLLTQIRKRCQNRLAMANYLSTKLKAHANPPV
jgi:hypothetical protein